MFILYCHVVRANKTCYSNTQNMFFTNPEQVDRRPGVEESALRHSHLVLAGTASVPSALIYFEHVPYVRATHSDT